VSVLHVVVAGEVGGAERMLVDLARSPAKAGRTHAIALITPNDRLRALLRDAGLDVEDRGPAREGPLTYLARTVGRADVAWLEEIIRRRRSTIVHLHTFASQVVGTRAALRAGAKVLRTEHSTRVFDDPSCWPFSKWSLRRAQASVCISDHVRRVALARAPWAEGIMHVVANGVDVERFAVRPLPPRQGRVRFVALGRLEPRKGVDIALRALARAPDAELAVVGEGESRAMLESLARTLGVADRVHFVGFAADVREEIARAHVALSSARSEGLGIALLEAMAMGRAVVALPTGGVPEIVRDGDTGWLAHGDDEDALAHVMRSAIGDTAEMARRGERARERVVASFSVDAMRDGYERRYGALDDR
jgi:glycosyltransferase involved in cell wall biosynthesis